MKKKKTQYTKKKKLNNTSKLPFYPYKNLKITKFKKKKKKKKNFLLYSMPKIGQYDQYTISITGI